MNRFYTEIYERRGKPVLTALGYVSVGNSPVLSFYKRFWAANLQGSNLLVVNKVTNSNSQTVYLWYLKDLKASSPKLSHFYWI